MSSTGTKKRAAPKPPQLGKENGNGTDVATKSEDQAEKIEDNQEEEFIMLKVVLPDQTVDEVSISSSMPIMDLRMQLCAKYKLSPSSHLVEPVGRENGHLIPHQPSNTLRSISADAVAIRQKVKEPPKAPKAPKVVEQTVRLTVKMSRSRQQVFRVSPRATLSSLMPQILEKSGAKTGVYEFLELRHPDQKNMTLDTSRCLEDYKLREVFLADKRVKQEEKASAKPEKPVTSPTSSMKKSKRLKSFFRLSGKFKHSPAPQPPKTKAAPAPPGPKSPQGTGEKKTESSANTNESNSKLREEDTHENSPDKKEKSAEMATNGHNEAPKPSDNNDSSDHPKKTKMAPMAPPRVKPPAPVPAVRAQPAGKKKAPAPPTPKLAPRAEEECPSPKARPAKPPRKQGSFSSDLADASEPNSPDGTTSAIEEAIKAEAEPQRTSETVVDGPTGAITDLSEDNISASPRSDDTASESDKETEQDTTGPSVDGGDKDDISPISTEEGHTSAVDAEIASTSQASPVVEDIYAVVNKHPKVLPKQEIEQEPQNETKETVEESSDAVYEENRTGGKMYAEVDADDQASSDSEQSEQVIADEIDAAAAVVIAESTEHHLVSELDDAALEDLVRNEATEVTTENKEDSPDVVNDDDLLAAIQAKIEDETESSLVPSQEIAEKKMGEADEESSVDSQNYEEEPFKEIVAESAVNKEFRRAESPEAELEIGIPFSPVHGDVIDQPPVTEDAEHIPGEGYTEKELLRSQDTDSDIIERERYLLPPPVNQITPIEQSFTTAAVAAPPQPQFDTYIASEEAPAQPFESEELLPPPPLPDDLPLPPPPQDMLIIETSAKSEPEKAKTDHQRDEETVASDDEDGVEDDETMQEIQKLKEQINRMRNKKAAKEAEEEAARKKPYTILTEQRPAQSGEIPKSGSKTFTFVPNQQKKATYEDYDSARLGINLSKSGEIKGIGVGQIKDIEAENDQAHLIATALRPDNNGSEEVDGSHSVEQHTAASPPPAVVREMDPPKPVQAEATLPIVIKEIDTPKPADKEETKTGTAVIKTNPTASTVPKKRAGGYVSSAALRQPSIENASYSTSAADSDEKDPRPKSTLPNYYKRFLGVNAFKSASNANIDTKKPSSSPEEKVQKPTSPIGPTTAAKPKSPPAFTKPLPTTAASEKESFSISLHENQKVVENEFPPPPSELLTPPPLKIDTTDSLVDPAPLSPTGSNKASSPPYVSKNFYGISSAKPFVAGGARRPVKFRPVSASFSKDEGN